MTNNKSKAISLGILIMLTLIGACKSKTDTTTQGLKDVYSGRFMIGAALNTHQASGEYADDVNVIKKHFNSIVAENCMKNEVIHPEKGEYNFDNADKFVAFGEANNMFIVGHTLVWHSQTAPWFFIDDNGNTVSRDTLIARMKDHIYTVVGRYKGRVNGWDVVNEAISDKKGLRQSPWVDIIGEDFLQLAFQFAHEADPEAELYYNDYNMYDPRKRADAIELITRLKDSGCRVDGIGMQAHYGLTDPNLEEVEKSIIAYGNMGLKVMFTELDISVLPFPTEKLTAEISAKYANSSEFNPYVQSLPDSVQEALKNRYEDLFAILLKHSDNITRVTFWGVNNKYTWRNNWPIAGRTDYPLLFDRQNNMVPAGKALMIMVKK